PNLCHLKTALLQVIFQPHQLFDIPSLITTANTDFNQHTRTVGWANTPLMSQQHGLKENIQLAVVMSNIEFDSLRSMQVMALKVVPPAPPTLMQWTSPQKAPSNRVNPSGPAEALFPLRPGGSHIPRMFERGLEAPRPPTALVFHPALRTSGGNKLSPRQPQHQ
ncbi:uncharacterized protein VP01_7160g1, partial [Puccinia sorghi]